MRTWAWSPAGWIALAALAACGGSGGGTTSSGGATAGGTTAGGSGAGSGLTLTGPLAGTGTTARAEALAPCGVEAGKGFEADLLFTLGGIQYALKISSFEGYTGPGSFPVGLDGAFTVSIGRPSPTMVAGATGTVTNYQHPGVSGTVVVAPGAASGTVDVAYGDGDALTRSTTPTGHIRGGWSCH